MSDKEQPKSLKALYWGFESISISFQLGVFSYLGQKLKLGVVGSAKTQLQTAVPSRIIVRSLHTLPYSQWTCNLSFQWRKGKDFGARSLGLFGLRKRCWAAQCPAQQQLNLEPKVIYFNNHIGQKSFILIIILGFQDIVKRVMGNIISKDHGHIIIQSCI